MRPPRIAILVLFVFATLFLFARSVGSVRQRTSPRSPVAFQYDEPPTRSPFRALFSFSGPFSLFPPNAAISLTDDNSTSFPARPAAFGPPLPAKGLSGQLWIGSGFADDNLQDGEVEGELGCSDVYDGWTSALSRKVAAEHAHRASSKADVGEGNGPENPKRTDPGNVPGGGRKARLDWSASSAHADADADDGTDDYLHEGIQAGKPQRETSMGSGTSHADIQSIQETAEVTGKVVLLSRGGCGFLEKVKWAQRRGATALIVGDNQRGGPLIQMYARGNAENVTIPSVFTSRTTAHLLSSLMQPGNFVKDMLDGSVGRSRRRKAAQAADDQRRARDVHRLKVKSGPGTSRKKAKTAKKIGAARSTARRSADQDEQSVAPRQSWLSQLLQSNDYDTASDRQRPASSGRLDWVLVDDRGDEKSAQLENSSGKAVEKSKSQLRSTPKTDGALGEGFQIGVQDWRDPDLAGRRSSDDRSTLAKSSQSEAQRLDGTKEKSSGLWMKSSPAKVNEPSGGSVTPGSGEYVAEVEAGAPKTSLKYAGDPAGFSSDGGFIAKLAGDNADTSATQDGEEEDSASGVTPSSKGGSPCLRHFFQWHCVEDHEASTLPLPADGGRSKRPHEGLWVTVTPSSGANPFFDTLLVLVISPLITLTVVYALLMLRARVRRRRWRAPKSVVEQLPVRTYHTVASTPSHSPRLMPSPPNASSPTTPLLQRFEGPGRPRSQTTTAVPGPSASLSSTTTTTSSSSSSDHVGAGNAAAIPVPGCSSRSGSPPREKKGTLQRPSQWKKYMGRQVECVVCLEEYVDGVSRVMSLPCGHEFHVECITPWLTTRRRTCPICKGDVVRSLARGSPASPRYEPYRTDSEDEREPSSSLPNWPFERSGSRSSNMSNRSDPFSAAPRTRESDVEEGLFPPREYPPNRSRRPPSGEDWAAMFLRPASMFNSRRRDEAEENVFLRPRTEDDY